jgi:hypothetical protein
MLRILEDQMKILGQRSARAFVARMAGYLRDAFPAETAGLRDGALDAWVDRNVRRAAGFGVDTEPEVAQYLLLALRLGEDAPDRLPWFRAALARPELAAPGKVRALVRAARAAPASPGAAPDLDRFVMKPFAA